MFSEKKMAKCESIEFSTEKVEICECQINKLDFQYTKGIKWTVSKGIKNHLKSMWSIDFKVFVQLNGFFHWLNSGKKRIQNKLWTELFKNKKTKQKFYLKTAFKEFPWVRVSLCVRARSISKFQRIRDEKIYIKALVFPIEWI